MYFRKLDSVGAVYASISTKKYANVNRISAKLKEEVSKDILEQALDQTMKMIPNFKVRLRRGFFWYYLEPNTEEPIVSDDSSFVLTTINDFDNNYYLFRVSFYRKRIHLDVSHILTDGMGMLCFLETLVANYLKLKYPTDIKQQEVSRVEMFSKEDMETDGFSKYYRTKISPELPKEKVKNDAFTIMGKRISRNYTKVVEGTMSVQSLKSLAKQHGVTITAYLTSLLIYSIYQEKYKYSVKKRPIVIAIPVNLRSYFDTNSMKNFFATILIKVDFRKRDYPLEEVLQLVSIQLKENLTKESLLNQFKANSKLFRSVRLRITPLFIKDLLVKYVGYMMNQHTATMALSNLGAVDLGDELRSYVDRFSVTAYTDKPSPIKAAICSFQDNLTLSFVSVLYDTTIEKRFFTMLSQQGIDIKISSNRSKSILGGIR